MGDLPTAWALSDSVVLSVCGRHASEEPLSLGTDLLRSGRGIQLSLRQVMMNFDAAMTLNDRIKRLPFTPLQFAIHVYALGELAWIGLDLAGGRLGANPLQAIQQRTGRLAITLLVLSLACTPLSNLLGWREPLKRSRTLGLYAFMVAFLHILIFLDLDNGLAWDFFAQTVAQKPYILFGMATFLMLIPLAVTSFDIWKARLGRNWKRLHQLVYFIAPVAVLHYALSKKGDIFALQGEIVRPLIYALIIVLLLALRLPFVRWWMVALRGRITRRPA